MAIGENKVETKPKQLVWKLVMSFTTVNIVLLLFLGTH